MLQCILLVTFFMRQQQFTIFENCAVNLLRSSCSDLDTQTTLNRMTCIQIRSCRSLVCPVVRFVCLVHVQVFYKQICNYPNQQFCVIRQLVFTLEDNLVRMCALITNSAIHSMFVYACGAKPCVRVPHGQQFIGHLAYICSKHVNLSFVYIHC